MRPTVLDELCVTVKLPLAGVIRVMSEFADVELRACVLMTEVAETPMRVTIVLVELTLSVNWLAANVVPPLRASISRRTS